jgi:uncharacterized protein
MDNDGTKKFDSAGVREKRYLARDKKFAYHSKPIIDSPGYDIIRHIEHHQGSIAEHSITVAYYAFRCARILGLKKRVPEMIRGALLHDFFHYDWRSSKPRSGGMHGFDHPREALENAEVIFGPLSVLERDCILHHMWPLTSVYPRYLESMIVSFSDKLVSIVEAVRAIRAGEGLGIL